MSVPVGSIEAVLELRDTLTPGLMSAAKGLEGIGSTLSSAGAGLLPLTAAIGGVGFAAIKMAGDFEQTKIAFTTMLGSGQAAKVFLDQLQAFAAATPFEFPDLVNASQKMLALGFAAKDVVPMLTTIGDAAAGLGGGAQMIDRITVALGQMSMKGKVSAQEMNQLAESGVSGWKYLAAAIGTDIPTAMAKAQKGTLDSGTAIKAILAGMQKDFGGMMEKQSQTLLGQISTLKDNFSFMLRDLGMALLPIANDVLHAFQAMQGPVQNAVTWFTGLSSTTKLVAVGIAAVAAAAGPVLMVLGSMASGVGALITLWTTMNAVVVASSTGLGTMAASFVAAQGGALAFSLTLATLLVQLAAVAAAFAVGWGIGTLIRDLTGLGEVADKAATALFALAKGENSDLQQGIDITKTWSATQRTAYTTFVAQQKEASAAVAAGTGPLKDHAAATHLSAEAAKAAAAALKQHQQAVASLRNELTGGKATEELRRLEEAMKGVDQTALSQSGMAKVLDTMRKANTEGVYASATGSLGNLQHALDLVSESDHRLLTQQAQLNTTMVATIPVNEAASHSMLQLAEGGMGYMTRTTQWVPITTAATKSTFDWTKALDVLKNTMQVLGISSDSLFAKLVGGFTVAAQASQQLHSSMTFDKDVKDADGNVTHLAGSFKSLKDMDWMGMASSAVNAFAAIAKGAESSKDAIGSMLGAAGAGASAGSAFGALGAAAGALFGASFAFGANEHIGTLPKILVAATLPFTAIGITAGAVFHTIFGNASADASKTAETMRAKFIEAAGGLETLQKYAAIAGVSLKDLFDAKTPEEFRTAVDAVTQGLGVQYGVQKQVSAEIDLQRHATEDHKAAQDLLNDAVSRYKFTTAELGPVMAAQKLDEQAGQLIGDWTILNAAGVEHNAILTKMGPTVSDYVNTCTAAGVKIPMEMKPMLQAFADAGQLTDAAGDKMTDLGGLTFAETLNEKIGHLIDRIGELIDHISGIPDKNVSINVTTYNKVIDETTGQGVRENPDNLEGVGKSKKFASGVENMLVSRPMLALVGEQGPERLTVRREGEPAVGGGGGGSSSSDLNALRADVQDLPRRMAREMSTQIRDAILSAKAS
jgi:tape measure domain-containing protein